MNHNAEQQIDAVLDGLRQTTSPAGMEQRILQAIEKRSQASPAWAFSWPAWPLRFAAMGVAAATVILMLVSFHPHLSKKAGVPDSMAAAFPPAALPGTGGKTEPRTPAKMDRLVAPHKHRADAPQDAQAVDAMNAPSRPAPELPLTEQERQLRRMANQEPAKEFASLHISGSPRHALPEDDVQAFFSGFSPQLNDGDSPQ